MKYNSQNPFIIPEETIRLARAIYKKRSNVYILMRDEVGIVYWDSEFADLFSHQGRPGESPGNLAMISVMQFAEGLSDEQAAEMVRSRIDWKYMLGLALSDSGFDGSVLSTFRGRLIAGSREAALLDSMLALFMERGWLKSRGKQRTDSTIVLAAIRELNRLEMVGETLRHALEALTIVAPSWLQGQVTPDWYDRYGSRFEQYRLPQEKGEREALALTIGQDGYYLLTAIYQAQQPLPYLWPIEAVQTLRQVWLQQYYWQEGQVSWREAGNLPTGATSIQSPYDPQARYSQKRETSWTGYKVHLTESCDDKRPHLITNVVTTTAAVPDVAVTEQIHTALIAKGLPPHTHLVDAGYPDGDLLLSSQRQGIDLLGPLPKDTSPQTRADEGFALLDFTIDWHNKQATCPGGHLSQAWYPNQKSKTSGETILVRFDPADCAPCCHRPLCTSAQKGRSIRLRPQEIHQAIQTARQREQTDSFQQLYHQRAGVEGTISQGTRAFALRRTRYIGLPKTHLQHLLTAAAMNITRLVAWLQVSPRSQTRRSHFARLALCT
jgi:transposase